MEHNVNSFLSSLIYLSLIVGGAALGFILSRFIMDKKLREAQKGAAGIRDLAIREAETIRKEAELSAKDLLIKLRNDFEKETKERRDEISAVEKRIAQREENLDKRVDLLEKKEKDINVRLDSLREKETHVHSREEELQKLIAEEKSRLHSISALSPEEAKKILLGRLDQELLNEKATRIR